MKNNRESTFPHSTQWTNHCCLRGTSTFLKMKLASFKSTTFYYPTKWRKTFFPKKWLANKRELLLFCIQGGGTKKTVEFPFSRQSHFGRTPFGYFITIPYLLFQYAGDTRQRCSTPKHYKNWNPVRVALSSGSSSKCRLERHAAFCNLLFVIYNTFPDMKYLTHTWTKTLGGAR